MGSQVKPIIIAAVLNYPAGTPRVSIDGWTAERIAVCIHLDQPSQPQNPSGIDGLAPATSAPVTSLPLSP